jgi:hypothetical protein
MLAILDCCHSAGMDVKSIDSTGIGERKAVPAAFPLDLAQTKAIPEYKGSPGAKAVADLLKGEGRAVLNSSTGSQLSWTRDDGLMSLFTYHLIEALTGHVPHDDEDTVVLVTDVMSWVTRRVEESAAAMDKKYPTLDVDQTPVMKTSGVFPIAQLIGGKGISKSAGETPPAPLEHLSPAVITTTFNQEGQNVKTQVNMGKNEGDIGHIGDNINTDGGAFIGGGVQMGSGDFVGRDKNVSGDEVHGDKFTGDKVGGDKFTGDKVMGNKSEGDSYNIGDITGSTGLAIGRESRADVRQTTIHQTGGGGGENLARLFAPLQRLVGAESPGNVSLVHELSELVTGGPAANDKAIGSLILKIANNVPAAKSALIGLFQHPAVSDNIGSITSFSLETLED